MTESGYFTFYVIDKAVQSFDCVNFEISDLVTEAQLN